MSKVTLFRKTAKLKWLLLPILSQFVFQKESSNYLLIHDEGLSSSKNKYCKSLWCLPERQNNLPTLSFFPYILLLSLSFELLWLCCRCLSFFQRQVTREKILLCVCCKSTRERIKHYNGNKCKSSLKVHGLKYSPCSTYLCVMSEDWEGTNSDFLSRHIGINEFPSRGDKI